MVKVLFIFIFFLNPLFASNINPSSISQEAYDAYTQGERADCASMRATYFNKALSLYKELNKYSNSGELYYNIGNTYFQLGEYALAILYYQKSLIQLPRNNKVKGNLLIAQEKAGIKYKDETKISRLLFFFHTSLSKEERQKIFIFTGTLSLVFWSLYIWIRDNRIKLLSIIFSLFFSIFFISLFWTIYFSANEGVIIKSSMLRRDAGEHYESVADMPVLAGSKVKILDITTDAKWVEIANLNGDVGFVPNEAIIFLR